MSFKSFREVAAEGAGALNFVLTKLTGLLLRGSSSTGPGSRLEEEVPVIRIIIIITNTRLHPTLTISTNNSKSVLNE